MATTKQKFVFELGIGFSLQEKKTLQKIVADLHGEVSYLLAKTTNYLVTTAELLTKGGYKVDTAKKYGVIIITVEELQSMKPAEPVQAVSPVLEEQIGGLELFGAPRDGSAPSSASSLSSTPRGDIAVVEGSSEIFGSGFMNSSESESESDGDADGGDWAASIGGSAATDDDDVEDMGLDLFGGDGASSSASDAQIPTTRRQPVLPLPIVLSSSTFLTPASPRSRDGSAPATPKSTTTTTSSSSPRASSRKPAAAAPRAAGADSGEGSPVPPEDHVYWSSDKTHGWRKKGSVTKKPKKIVMMLTAEELALMQSLDTSKWPTLAPRSDAAAVVSNDNTGTPDIYAHAAADAVSRTPLMALPPGVVLDPKKRSETFANKSTTVIDPNAPWVAVVKNDPSIRKKIIPPSYLGQKIFVGGISFEDIAEKALSPDKQKERILERLKSGYRTAKIPKKKLEKKMASVRPEVWSDKKIKEVREIRMERFKRLFQQFGPIINIQETWEDGFIFVTYKNKSDAETAVKTVKHSETRKGLCRDIKEKLRATGKDALGAPRADFYVRWPQYCVKMKAKTKQAKKEKLQKQQEEDATANAKTTANKKKRREPKKAKKQASSSSSTAVGP